MSTDPRQLCVLTSLSLPQCDTPLTATLPRRQASLGGPHPQDARRPSGQEERIRFAALGTARRDRAHRTVQEGCCRRGEERRGGDKEGACVCLWERRDLRVLTRTERVADGRAWARGQQCVQPPARLVFFEQPDPLEFPQRAPSRSASTTALRHVASSLLTLRPGTATSRSATRTTALSPRTCTLRGAKPSRATSASLALRSSHQCGSLTRLCAPSTGTSFGRQTPTTASRSRTKRCGRSPSRTTTTGCSRQTSSPCRCARGASSKATRKRRSSSGRRTSASPFAGLGVSLAVLTSRRLFAGTTMGRTPTTAARSSGFPLSRTASCTRATNSTATGISVPS